MLPELEANTYELTSLHSFISDHNNQQLFTLLLTFIIPTFPNGNIAEKVLQGRKYYLFIVEW